MKKLALLLLIVLVSCSPQKRLSRIFEDNPELKPQTSTEVIETIKEVEVYRDTTVVVEVLKYLPKIDTVYRTIKLKGKPLNSYTLHISSNLANAWGWIYRNRLNMSIADKDTTLQIRLDNALKESSYYKHRLEEKNTVITEKYVPNWMKKVIWVNVIALIILVLYIVYRFKKKQIDIYARYFVDLFK